MRTGGPDFPGAFVGAGLRALYDRPSRVDHVVQQERTLALHITDDVHDLRLIRPFTPFIDNRQVGLETLRERAGALHAAGIRRNDDQIAHLFLCNVIQQDWQGVEVVHRHVEEPLNLPGMKVHREHAISTGGTDEICRELSRYRHSRLIFPILARVPEVGNDGRDAIGR